MPSDPEPINSTPEDVARTASFEAVLKPALEQARVNLTAAGYTYDETWGCFMRETDDSPIEVLRVLRYRERVPTNRRRARDRRKATRRERLRAAKQPVEARS